MGGFQNWAPLSEAGRIMSSIYFSIIPPCPNKTRLFCHFFQKNLRQAAVIPVNDHFFSQIADSLHQPGRLNRVIRVLGRAKVALQGLHIKVGTEEGRQILSGIAEWYPDPSVLVGKKVLIVANLKPRKMRGEVSQGMLLSAEKDGNVTVVTVPDSLVPGMGVE